MRKTKMPRLFKFDVKVQVGDEFVERRRSAWSQTLQGAIKKIFQNYEDVIDIVRIVQA